MAKSRGCPHIPAQADPTQEDQGRDAAPAHVAIGIEDGVGEADAKRRGQGDAAEDAEIAVVEVAACGTAQVFDDPAGTASSKFQGGIAQSRRQNSFAPLPAGLVQQGIPGRLGERARQDRGDVEEPADPLYPRPRGDTHAGRRAAGGLRP